MKKQFLIFCLVLGSLQLFAQDNATSTNDWQEVSMVQTNPKINIKMAMKPKSWGMGQQFYTATVRSLYSKKLHITGYIFANLTCGGESKAP